MPAALIVAYIVLSLAISNFSGGAAPVQVIVPQIILSVLLYPVIGRVVAAFDRFRLVPFREIG